MREEAAHQHGIIEPSNHFYFHVIELLYFITLFEFVVEIATKLSFPEIILILLVFISQSHSFLGLLGVTPGEASVE